MIVLEMMHLRSLVGVSRIDRVGKEEVQRRAGIEKESASTFYSGSESIYIVSTHGENGLVQQCGVFSNVVLGYRYTP